MRNLVAAFKFILFLLLCLIIVPLQSSVILINNHKSMHVLPRLWHKCVCTIFNIRYHKIGRQHEGQAVFMSNHLSYLDIPLLGGMLNASFVAKSEVSGWPVFGFLSKLQRTAFIVRKTGAIRKAKNELQERLENGESLIIFPEGTSSDGYDIKPLKSSLFELSITSGVAIQPITLELKTVNGKRPQTIEERRLYTWPLEDDIEVHKHLWRFAKAKSVMINVHFHDALLPDQFESRKALSQKCFNDIAHPLGA